MLAAVYLTAMILFVLAAPWTTIDQTLYLMTAHPYALRSDITVLDVQPYPSTDYLANRRLIAQFLEGAARSGQRIKAIVVDEEFDACQEPCDRERLAVRNELVRAIGDARAKNLEVYGVENLAKTGADDAAETTGTLNKLDEEIYGPRGFAGNVGHSRIYIAESTGLSFYHPCYENVRIPTGDVARAEDLWAVGWRILKTTRCDPRPIEFAVGPRIGASMLPYSTIPHRSPTYYAITAAHPFPNGELNDYVVLGNLEQDTLEIDEGLVGSATGESWERVHGPGALNIPGPELLAWELSDVLERNQIPEGEAPSPAHEYRVVHPMNRGLYLLIVVFSLLTLLSFVAIFFPLRRLRLKAARRFVPWLSAVGSSLMGLTAFAVVEGLFSIWAHQDQPQVTLVSFHRPNGGARGRSRKADALRTRSEERGELRL